MLTTRMPVPLPRTRSTRLLPEAPFVGAILGAVVLLAACGSASARGSASAPAASAPGGSLVNVAITSATFVVTTDDAPPADGPFTTSFTTAAQLARLQAAIKLHPVGVVGSSRGSIDGCTGGDGVEITVRISGRASPLEGQTQTCGGTEQGTITGDVQGLVDDLSLDSAP
jgi:hypothetical protein